MGLRGCTGNQGPTGGLGNYTGNQGLRTPLWAFNFYGAEMATKALQHPCGGQGWVMGERGSMGLQY